MLDDVEDALVCVQEEAELPNVLRVAAHAALMLAQKYHSMNDECEVYRIAISKYCFIFLPFSFLHSQIYFAAMCPDKKLVWFAEHSWDSEAIEEVRQLVIRRWNESYKPVITVVAATATTRASSMPPTPVVVSYISLSESGMLGY